MMEFKKKYLIEIHFNIFVSFLSGVIIISSFVTCLMNSITINNVFFGEIVFTRVLSARQFTRFPVNLLHLSD